MRITRLLPAGTSDDADTGGPTETDCADGVIVWRCRAGAAELEVEVEVEVDVDVAVDVAGCTLEPNASAFTSEIE
jgi:hypothetical protein